MKTSGSVRVLRNPTRTRQKLGRPVEMRRLIISVWGKLDKLEVGSASAEGMDLQADVHPFSKYTGRLDPTSVHPMRLTLIMNNPKPLPALPTSGSGVGG